MNTLSKMFTVIAPAISVLVLGALAPEPTPVQSAGAPQDQANVKKKESPGDIQRVAAQLTSSEDVQRVIRMAESDPAYVGKLTESMATGKMPKPGDWFCKTHPEFCKIVRGNPALQVRIVVSESEKGNDESVDARKRKPRKIEIDVSGSLRPPMIHIVIRF